MGWFSLASPLLSPFWKCYCSRCSLLLYATGRTAVMMIMVMMAVVIVEWLMKVEWQGRVGGFPGTQSSTFWEQNQPITPPTTMPKQNILGTFPGWSAPRTSKLWELKNEPAFKCVIGFGIWDLGTKYRRKSYAWKQLMFMYDIIYRYDESAHQNSYGNKGSALLPNTTPKVET